MFVAALLAIWSIQLFMPKDPATPPPTYNQFIAQVDQGKVDAVTMNPTNGSLTVTPKADAAAAEPEPYVTGYPPGGAEDLTTYLRAAKVKVTIESKSDPGIMATLLAWLFPLLLILLFVGFFIAQARAGRQLSQTLGRSPKGQAERPAVGFDDVAGMDDVLEELKEVRDFLAEPARFQALGAKIPKGVLLAGPPGTGKTLLARAVAGEAGVPFFALSGSDFVEMFVGVGASRVRDLFTKARQSAPSILFIDEIDAVGRQRGLGMGGGHDEREQTLNQLLVEMDGFDQNSGVIVMAATNRSDVLDPALLRPGRFDRQITVGLPDRDGRLAILKVHSRGKPLADHIDLESLASQTVGLSGADLANIINEGALLAGRRHEREITQADLDEGLLRAVAGPARKGRVLTPEQRRLTAYHELGHAMVGHLTPGADPVRKISLVSRGQALGFTISAPDEDDLLLKQGQLEARLAMTLGGRAAELLIYDELSSGAAGDLEQGTSIARSMVSRFGMSDLVGPRAVGGGPTPAGWWDQGSPNSDALSAAVDEEVKRILSEAADRAYGVLERNRDLLEVLTELLLEYETLEGDEFARLMAGEDPDVVLAHRHPAAAPAAGDGDTSPSAPSE